MSELKILVDNSPTRLYLLLTDGDGRLLLNCGFLNQVQANTPHTIPVTFGVSVKNDRISLK